MKSKKKLDKRIEKIKSKGTQVIGHFDKIKNSIAYGWVYNPETPNKPQLVNIVDENGLLYGKGIANKWRKDLLNIGYNEGFCGFELELKRSTESKPEVLILVGENGIEIDRIDVKINNPVKNFYLRKMDYWKILESISKKGKSKDDDSARNEYKKIIYEMYKNKKWFHLKNALLDDSFSEFKVEKISFLRDLFKDIIYLNCTDSIYYDSDISAKIYVLHECVQLKNENLFFDICFDIYPEHIENLIANFISYRPSVSFSEIKDLVETLGLYHILDLYPDVEKLFNKTQQIIRLIPYLPDKNFISYFSNLLVSIIDASKCINERVLHPANVKLLNCLRVLLTNSRGRKLLNFYSDFVKEYIKVLLEKTSSEPLKSMIFFFEMDFSYVTGDQSRLLELLSQIEHFDINDIIWNVRFLESILLNNFSFFSAEIKPRIVDILSAKLNVERLGKDGITLLLENSKSFLISDNSNLNIKYYRKLAIELLKYWREKGICEFLLNLLDMPAFHNSAKDIQDKIRLLSFLRDRRGLYLQSDCRKQSIDLSRINRDIAGAVLRENSDFNFFSSIDFSHDATAYGAQKINHDISVYIHSEIISIPQDYIYILSRYGKKNGIKVVDSKLDADVCIYLRAAGMVTPKIFDWLQVVNPALYEIIDKAGNALGNIEFKSASKNNKVLITEGIFSPSRKNLDRCIYEDFGFLKVDDYKDIFSFYTRYCLFESGMTALSSGKDTIYTLRSNFNEISKAECVAFVVQRNEKDRLKAFFSYYRALGVDRFVVLDNFSDDETPEFLFEQSDVDIFVTPQPYSSSKFGVDWLDFLIRTTRVGKWSLILDPDEQLVIKNYNNISDLINNLEKNGYDSIYTPFIDVYPGTAMSKHQCVMTSDFSKEDLFFDEHWFTVFNSFGGYCDLLPTFQGGVRSRVFGLNSVILNKVPLFKFKPEMSLHEGVHWLDGSELEYGQAVLLHHKYNKLFYNYVKREAERGEHWNGGAEYKMYAEMISKNSELELYSKIESKRIKSSDDFNI
ncbi:glycosyltransferase family 2 protein [Microbulbifer thermotolerans]|uniref:Glycosyltransferase family 2 protein n=1 Tax=Microbulbifer thermotolerans TaxID=252514 RepID=A0AB35HXK2_MICTH|nr:glycosyltransferase family 2 protein [Microbulbifer thermotolerans]MCX2802179.1 glycosyltransferase family 2 protein [Microbulbifer thermotolerans]